MGKFEEEIIAVIQKESDKNSDYYVECEEFERLNLKTVKDGFKLRDGVPLTDLIRNLTRVKNMEMREDDVFSIGYPKSGTTWLEEIIWLLINDFDFEKAKSIYHYFRIIFADTGYSKRRLAELPSPRLFKSHLPLRLLPDNLQKKAKIVYILRNPKDTIVSSYNFYQHAVYNRYIGTLDNMVDDFIQGNMQNGCWFDHVNTYTSTPGIYIIHYEDLVEVISSKFILKYDQKDPYTEIRKLAHYLDKNPTEEQLKALLEYVTFDNLKNNDSCKILGNFYSPEMVFFNQGKIGNWKNHLTEEQSKKIDEAIKNKLTYKRPIQFEPSINKSQ